VSWTALFVIFFAVLGTVLVAVLFKGVREWLKSNKDWLQTVCSLVGVIAVVLTALSVYSSIKNNADQQQQAVKQQRQAAEQQRQAAQVQSKAATIGLLQAHLVLATQYPQFASRQTKRQIVEARYQNPDKVMQGTADPTKADLNIKYVWFAAHATFTAETIYSLTQDLETENWKPTVLGLVDTHKTYVLHKIFPCEQYSETFLKLLKDHFKEEFSCEPA